MADLRPCRHNNGPRRSEEDDARLAGRGQGEFDGQVEGRGLWREVVGGASYGGWLQRSGLTSSGLGLEEGSWVWFRKEGT